MKLSLTAGALAALLAAFPISTAVVRSSHATDDSVDPQGRPPVGYSDTPLLPGQTWKVHDVDRPQPDVVTPGVGVGFRAPSDALVLFDGTDLSQWRAGEQPAGWKVENGYAEVNGSGNIESIERFGDCQLHVEWASPEKVESGSQGRGNSGVFLMGRYEVQILDSFENRSYADGGAGAMYGQFPPLVNVSRPPGEWQSYDIIFHAPRFADDRLAAPARLTLLHNGVVVHHDQAFLGATRHREVATYSAHPPTGPIVLQDHGNPVRFRNIWVRRI